MPITANPSKRRNDDDGLENVDAKKRVLELPTFTKYSKLVPELRKPVLEYSKLSTLKGYAECSKLCNSEIQMYNTKAPKCLWMKQEDDYIEVLFRYGDPAKGARLTNDEEAQEYVLQAYRYVNEGKTGDVFVDLRQWLEKVMEIERLGKFSKLHIWLYQSMLNDFLRFANTTSFRISHLYLHDGIDDRVVLPSEFFKSNIFKSARRFTVNTKYRIEKIDFVQSDLRSFQTTCWMEVDMIQEKFAKLRETKFREMFQLMVYLPSNEPRVHNIAELFPQRYAEGDGMVQVNTNINAAISRDGKRLCITYM